MKPKKLKGFARLSIEERKRISSLGGKKAHENGTANTFSTETAKIANKKRGKRTSKPENL
jgi:hypothetical protein